MTKKEMLKVLHCEILLPLYSYKEQLAEIANELEQSEKVRHGYWIETIENGKMKRVTSCCGDNQTTLTCWYTPRYCPNCGAKMEKHFHEAWKKVDEVKHEVD